MTREERQKRLARLTELNKRSLGVSYFGEVEKNPLMVAGMRRSELAELRDRISYFYRKDVRDSRSAWTRKYRNV